MHFASNLFLGLQVIIIILQETYVCIFKKLELLLKQNHQEQNQANGDTNETTATTETKHMKSKLGRALGSWSFKVSP